MINQHQEESIFLDFKLKSVPDGSKISKDDKRNYAKALSAFANTSGELSFGELMRAKMKMD